MVENAAAAQKKAMNKTEVLVALSEATGLTKQQVGSLFDELAKLIGKNLGEQGPGTFAIPGLLQIKAVRKPATPERKGINPFTKEETVFKAKPARSVVKVVALKGLKNMVYALPINDARQSNSALSAPMEVDVSPGRPAAARRASLRSAP